MAATTGRPTLGLLGFGSFGRFAAAHLKRHFEVVVHDARDITAEAAAIGVPSVPLAVAAGAPIVVVAVPVQSQEDLLAAMAPHVRPDALVLDVSSVKLKPIEMMQRLLPATVRIVGTHPLFGPQSGKDGIAGLPIALCPGRSDEATLVCIHEFLGTTLGLKVIRTDPDRHDKQMAYVQALTHFVSRAVGGMDLPKTEMATRAYRRLLEMKADLEHDSMELFFTIERMNPYAPSVREELMRRMEELVREIG